MYVWEWGGGQFIVAVAAVATFMKYLYFFIHPDFMNISCPQRGSYLSCRTDGQIIYKWSIGQAADEIGRNCVFKLITFNHKSA